MLLRLPRAASSNPRASSSTLSRLTWSAAPDTLRTSRPCRAIPMRLVGAGRWSNTLSHDGGSGGVMTAPWFTSPPE